MDKKLEIARREAKHQGYGEIETSDESSSQNRSTSETHGLIINYHYRFFQLK